MAGLPLAAEVLGPSSLLLAQSSAVAPFIYTLAKTGELVKRPIGQALGERGVRVLDLTTPLMGALGGGPLCSVLTQPAKCRSHFNAEGNRLIAQVVYDYLGREGLLPGTAEQDRRGAGTPHQSS